MKKEELGEKYILINQEKDGTFNIQTNMNTFETLLLLNEAQQRAIWEMGQMYANDVQAVANDFLKRM